MFDAPSRFSNPEPVPSQATGWEYVEELRAMATWLTEGPDASVALSEAVSGLDIFRGRETVVRWIHRFAASHAGDRAVPERVTELLDSLVEGAVVYGPADSDLRSEVEARLDLLESLCCIPDNYRCALLLKEGAGLSVERSADLMGVSTASLRSILYRARQAL